MQEGEEHEGRVEKEREAGRDKRAGKEGGCR